jgi:hypothetical protein
VVADFSLHTPTSTIIVLPAVTFDVGPAARLVTELE